MFGTSDPVRLNIERPTFNVQLRTANPQSSAASLLMANRQNHYEAALEAFLRERGVPYVAVDEAKRSRLGGGSLKSLDFIVSPPGQRGLLVDVKGRRFPAGRGRQFWKNWATQEDLRSMSHWQQLFGANFQAMFVFAYHVLGDTAPLPAGQLFRFRDQLYGLVGIRLDHYASTARVISPRWQTLAMPATQFCQLARPLVSFLVSR